MPKLAIMGAGNLRCAPHVISGVSDFAGEEPLSVWFYEPDVERLDFFDRFARLCFGYMGLGHELRSRETPEEVLEDADLVIFLLEDRHAKHFKVKTASEAASVLLPEVPSSALVLHLPLEWPPELSEEELTNLPHEILRYLREDEPLFHFYKKFDGGHVKRWLENPLGFVL